MGQDSIFQDKAICSCIIKVENNCVGDNHHEDKLESQLMRNGQGSFKGEYCTLKLQFQTFRQTCCYTALYINIIWKESKLYMKLLWKKYEIQKPCESVGISAPSVLVPYGFSCMALCCGLTPASTKLPPFISSPHSQGK